MEGWTVEGFVEVVAVLMWPIGIGAIFWQRLASGKNTIGARVI